MWVEKVTKWIFDDNVVKNKIKNHIKNMKQKINKKLIITTSIIAILFNKWINQNSFFMIIIKNIIWLDDHFKQHWVCIEFVEINNFYLKENLVFIIYSILMKFNIC